MFQIICQIGPLSVYEYGIAVAVIAAVGALSLIILAFSKGVQRKAVFVVCFWVLALSVLAMIPLMMKVTIYSYGLMMAIAVIVCTLMLARDAYRANIKIDIVFDVVFWAVVGGVAGARLFYVLLNFSFFFDYPEEIIKIQNGGLAWQGGLIAGFLVSAMFVRAKKLKLSTMLDFFAPYVALGQSIGRIGCFLNGCCYGTEVVWGIYFPLHDAILHPTQLYLAGGLFVIFLTLKRYQKFSQTPGLVFVLYLILASTLRFVVEFFRADHEPLFLGLSVFQFVCFGVVFVAIWSAFALLIKHSKMDDH